MNRFPAEVEQRLGYYVYRLIDPRNGSTFYVGKGRGNRVFSHAAGKLDRHADPTSSKKKKILEIRLAGFDVGHVIYRHGLDEGTAVEVEAALLDAFPGVTNAIGGVGSGVRGVMHAEEIVRLYKADVANFAHRMILISVNRTAAEMDLLDATRYAWKLDPRKARRAEYVLAVEHGMIRGAFVADEWRHATREFFPEYLTSPRPGRWGFVGKEAPSEIKKLYVGKRIPDAYRKKGAANPIKYTF